MVKNKLKIKKKTPYICNRCGRNNFINGHALGGHKKYCKKPEYDKARIRNSLKKPRNNYKPKNKKWRFGIEIAIRKICFEKFYEKRRGNYSRDYKKYFK